MSRNELTEQIWPGTIDVHGFIDNVTEDFIPFLENMKNMKIDRQQKTVEEWMDIYCRWSEIFPEGIKTDK
jgi:tetrahydromethanopterin S-methyltransferase subunit A